MTSPTITATWQAAALSGLSNVLGQAVKCYRSNRPFSLNTADLFHFVLFSILSTPPNFMWQQYLEQKFPAYTTKPGPTTEKKTDDVSPKPETSLNKTNTAIKFALDQTLAATINTLLFIAGLDLLRGRSIEAITAHCREQFWPIMFAGQKLWPAVSLLNFALVPLQYRMLVGGVVGLFWSTYLSMISSSTK